MKYLTLLALALALWFLIDEFVLQDRKSEGLDGYGDKWRDLGRRLHVVFGILAILILLFMVGRLVYRSLIEP